MSAITPITLDAIDGEAATHTATITRITSTRPSKLSKTYRLRPSDGELVKGTTANMVAGKAETFRITDCQELADLLLTLNSAQALAAGVVTDSAVALTTKEEWIKLGRPADPQPRSKDAFEWPQGPGVMVLDHDPDAATSTYSRDELVQAIRTAAPGLAGASMVWWPSSSSHIFHGDTDLTGLKGQRLYILVEDARDIPRAGAALVERLWASGFGYIVVSRSGAKLERTVIDSSVWQTNRLDFAAGAACTPPLEQRRGEPVIIEGERAFVDTTETIPDPDAEVQAAANAAKAKAKSEASEEAEQAQAIWETERTAEMAERLGANDDDGIENIRQTVRRAVQKRSLTGDYDIIVRVDGVEKHLTVGEVMDDPVRFHKCQTLDPLEPEYDGRRWVGKLFLIGGRPNLYSFAHGGVNFKLVRQPSRIEIVKGRQFDVVEQVLDALRNQPDVFDFGDALVLVEGGRVFPLDQASLCHYLGGILQFWTWKSTPSGQYYVSEENPPPAIAREILSLSARRNLKRLEAVVTAPTMRRDGTVLTKPGYDERSGLLLNLDDKAHVPNAPTNEQVQTALDKIMHPFVDFPLVGPNDWGVLLAALLTATVRPDLPTAPAVGFDAPTQGSGKTLLATCVSALGTGEMPTVWPHTADKSDEEVRKRIFAALRSGTRALVWDNVVGFFDSAAMAAALTWPTFTDRVLGESTSPTIPNKAQIILTGNNLSLAGDMPRRVLKCRIDPETEKPFARRFALDPLAYVQAHRVELIEAALTLIRGWLTSTSHRAPGRMASFEQWDDLVRQTVAWIGREFRPGEYGDPMNAIDEAQGADPEQEALAELLHAWWDCFGSEAVTARRVWEKAHGNGFVTVDNRLLEAIIDACNAPHTSKGLGKALGYRKDKIVGGLRLRAKGKGRDSLLWAVESLSSR